MKKVEAILFYYYFEITEVSVKCPMMGVLFSSMSKTAFHVK